MDEFETRVGAYGVVVREGRILLAHFVSRTASNWTLPGGGLERGEDGPTAVVREMREETGYDTVIDGLLGVDSVQIPAGEREDGRERHLHSLRLIYRARIVGGERTREVGGSTDDVRWFPLTDVPRLERVSLVEVGLRLWRDAGTLRPAAAHGT